MTLCGIVIATLSLSLGSQLEEGWFERALTLYWNGEYEQTLEVLSFPSLDDLSDDEKLEYHKYRAFSLVALGKNDLVQKEFISLLAIDPHYRFDPSMVSPKILEQFELAKDTLIEDLFRQGKASYFDEAYRTAINFMDKILALDSGNELAQEYRQLSSEQITLTEKLASFTARVEEEEKAPEPEPPEEPPDRIYHQGADVMPAVLLKRVDPRYPAVDFRLRNEGRVVLLIVIDRQGSVEQSRVLRSVNSRLDNVALEAVNQWKYRPARRNGTPVRYQTVVGIDFNLGER